MPIKSSEETVSIHARQKQWQLFIFLIVTLQQALQDPSMKPRYASTSIIEDTKIRQADFLTSNQNAATTVIMEPIPKTQRVSFSMSHRPHTG